MTGKLSTTEALTQALQADGRFFAALRAADGDALRRLLTERFRIVGVADGAVIDGPTFIDAVANGLAQFDAIDVLERDARMYGEVAVIVGRTQMRGSVSGQAFAAASRYTHVLVRGADTAWRLANAQGTPISEADDATKEAW